MADPQEPTLAPQGTVDPLMSFRFWVEMKGVIEAVFLECSGLNMERETHEVKEGGVNDHVHVLPGRTKYPHIVLKHGLALSQELWDWYQQGLYDCQVKRIEMSIIVRDSEQKETKRWNVKDAFPVKWGGPDLKTDSSQVAVETIEIAHHGLTLKSSTS